MYVHAFLDFDDTLFPSSFMTKFFNRKTGLFTPPLPVLDHITHIDTHISEFIGLHMAYCRFRILTHATIDWIYSAIRLMPKLKRFIDWNYISVITCNQHTKQHTLSGIVNRETDVDLYFCVGDSAHDVESLPGMLAQVKKDFKYRSILLVKNPSLSVLEFEWGSIPALFLTLLTVEQQIVQRHFLVSDDCKHSEKDWCQEPAAS